MKATPTLRKLITDAVQAVDHPERRAIYRSLEFPRADKVKDLDRRYRWDLLWFAIDLSGHEFRTAFYGEDLDNAHIDTVLRSAVPAL